MFVFLEYNGTTHVCEGHKIWLSSLSLGSIVKLGVKPCWFILTMQIKELQPLQKKFTDMKAQLELKMYDLSLFLKRAEQNEHHKVLYLHFAFSFVHISSFSIYTFLA